MCVFKLYYRVAHALMVCVCAFIAALRSFIIISYCSPTHHHHPLHASLCSTLLCSTNNPQRNIRRHTAQLLQHQHAASQLVHFLLQLIDEVVRLLVVRRRAGSLALRRQLPQHVLKIVIHLNRHLKLLLAQLLPQLQQLLAPRQSLRIIHFSLFFSPT